MRVLSLVCFFAISATFAIGGCGGDSNTGVCNVCPTARSVNTDMCATQGTAASCKSAAIMMVTDSDCGLGKPPTTHLACVFSECAGEIDCTKIASF